MTRWRGDGLGDVGLLGGLWKHGTGVGLEGASQGPSVAGDGSLSLKGQAGTRDRAGVGVHSKASRAESMAEQKKPQTR